MYIYSEPEPEQREVYVDNTGKPHFDREAAIKANIYNDLLVAIRTDLAKTIVDDADARDYAARSMIRILERNALMVKDHFDNMD